jgi:TRAP-type C4-dicarboxylate transport system permease small subunit
MVPVIFVLTGLMFLSVLAQVVFRYVFTHPVAWSEELARYLMIWAASLATSEAYFRKSHVGVTVLGDFLPPPFKKWHQQIVHLIVLLLMIVIVYYGLDLSLLLVDQESPALSIPMAWAYLAIPAGAFFIGVYALYFIIEGMRQKTHIDQTL